MSHMHRHVGNKNGMAVYVSEDVIAQKGLPRVMEELGMVRRWPVQTDLSGNAVMVDGETHEEAVQRYLSSVK